MTTQLAPARPPACPVGLPALVVALRGLVLHDPDAGVPTVRR